MLAMWRRMRQRVVPLAVRWYHQDVADELGLPAVEGGLREQLGFYAGFRPGRLSSERTELGTLVTTKASGAKGETIDAAYLVRRSGREWRIVYDTVLEDGLAAYARRVAGFGTSRESKQQAEAAAAALSERYRLLASAMADERARRSTEPARESTPTPVP